MKKIFIVFLTILIMVTCLVMPVAASMPGTFGSYENLLDSSFQDDYKFYWTPSEGPLMPMFSVELNPNTSYTFISTNGSKSFYFGQQFLYDDYYSVFSESYNFLRPFTEFNSSGLTCSVQNGSIFIYGTKYGGNRITFNNDSFLLEPGTYYFRFDYLSGDFYRSGDEIVFYLHLGDFSYPISISNWNLIDKHIVVDITEPTYFNGYSLDIYNDNVIFYDFKFNLTLSLFNVDLPISVNPVFSENFTTVYTFNTGNLPSDNSKCVIGINDLLYGSQWLFSANQSSENEFFLIEGELTADQITEIIDGNNYQNGYNSGFTQGYKEGEYDGLNSSKFMNSTLLTAISAPFVIVSSALDFDILGINFYNILKVLFTLLLVAFVVNKLKGRE